VRWSSSLEEERLNGIPGILRLPSRIWPPGPVPVWNVCGGDHTQVDLYIVLQIGEIIVRLSQRQTVGLHSKLLCIKQSRHGKNKRLRNWMIGRRIQ